MQKTEPFVSHKTVVSADDWIIFDLRLNDATSHRSRFSHGSLPPFRHVVRYSFPPNVSLVERVPGVGVLYPFGGW